MYKYIKTGVVVGTLTTCALILLAVVSTDILATGLLSGAIVLCAALYTGLLIKRFEKK